MLLYHIYKLSPLQDETSWRSYYLPLTKNMFTRVLQFLFISGWPILLGEETKSTTYVYRYVLNKSTTYVYRYVLNKSTTYVYRYVLNKEYYLCVQVCIKQRVLPMCTGMY